MKGHLVHHAYRDLAEHLSTIERYTAVSAARAIEDGVVARWWDVVFRPPLHFAKAYLLKVGFLDGLRGWCVAWLGAIYVLLKWIRIYLGGRDEPPGGMRL